MSPVALRAADDCGHHGSGFCGYEAFGFCYNVNVLRQVLFDGRLNVRGNDWEAGDLLGVDDWKATTYVDEMSGKSVATKLCHDNLNQLQGWGPNLRICRLRTHVEGDIHHVEACVVGAIGESESVAAVSSKFGELGQSAAGIEDC